MKPLSPHTCHCFGRAWLALLLAVGLGSVPSAKGVLFYDTSDPSHNTSAPGGALAGSGWQYEGEFGSFLGTAVGQNYFITATHVGVQSSTFVQSAMFTGTTDVTYNIDPNAFGGAGFYDVPGTDLRLYRTIEAFSTWAPLYQGTSELGMNLVVTGRGGARGSSILLDTGLGPQLKGWFAQGSDGTVRWGTNQISGILPTSLSGTGDLLMAEFNAIPSSDEAMLSVGDSGGGVFISDGGVWKLAGINYAVDGAFNTSPTNAGAFTAALFDTGGYWQGQDSSWTFTPDLPVDSPANFYASRISTSAAAINAIVVPEPGSLLLGMAGLAFLGRRRKR